MDRRTFVGLSAATLLCAPTLVRAQRRRHVTIIGAGSAGLMAAYHLTQAGVDVLVLEAAADWGGRIKRLTGFSDVPLDLGAEWIHDDPGVLGRILGKGDTDLGVKTINYQPQTYQFWDQGRLRNFDALRHTYREVKFYDTTWYGFFESFVLPSVGSKIRYNAQITRIETQGTEVSIRLNNGVSVTTDQVIVTVPLSVLQKGHISFSQDLRPRNLSDIQDITFGGGFKAFLKFKERFYPDMLYDGPRSGFLEDTWSEKLYFDAAFRKPTQDNILGLFTVSEDPLRRTTLGDQALLADILTELTGIFGPVVTRSFQHGVVQNWSQSPHIMGAYSMTNDSARDIPDILAPVAGKLFFAGEALGQADRSTVHGAAFSARSAADQILMP
ncbi:NAD(P)/FAD-dependent oxidoreductase [Phaeobacter sp.]|uniref:flavin monoamine oxidase family protein n=1 Tax=Phaeobacter sp. TaxID=1902409 RepID=UPI002600AA5C|nr:NAD(P)/FAD-dependent oxidoreductase [Phaeobacter sp.]